MNDPSERLMRAVMMVLRVLIALNLLCFAVFAAILALSFLAEAAVTDALQKGQAGIDAGLALVAVRLVMVLGMMVVPLAHLLLSRLRSIVESVREGDPFVPQNANRLTHIAWSLLGIQICDLAFGAIAVGAGMERWFEWQFSLTGWLSVLLLFVLAKVFDHGTRLREDLAGTV